MIEWRNGREIDYIDICIWDFSGFSYHFLRNRCNVNLLIPFYGTADAANATPSLVVLRRRKFLAATVGVYCQTVPRRPALDNDTTVRLALKFQSGASATGK